eukprot:89517-Chlamydomonas_euryale.AAC.1
MALDEGHQVLLHGLRERFSQVSKVGARSVGIRAQVEPHGAHAGGAPREGRVKGHADGQLARASREPGSVGMGGRAEWLGGTARPDRRWLAWSALAAAAATAADAAVTAVGRIRRGRDPARLVKLGLVNGADQRSAGGGTRGPRRMGA